ncbi:class I SAM-dependent methyltransferase [Tabrizicola fusiformis]|uniref:class I SAM-dependent methyltransferase n=1 Tax=Tabrizicola sp. SY72 TaxID=2741673 RepID=UPI0015717AED|nr:class I SAM-dependent methyltransferase [Tabrizicola sp. SY72]NTT84849.1 class I SAM-dependent methyltransferase [Tabrizicola sp. SY72]
MTDPGHRATYDRSAADWHATRAGTYPERPWIALVAGQLHPGARVLDLGCGSGHPVAADLLARGFAVTGLDFSEAMLAIARATLPAGDWIAGDMRDLPVDGPFEAVIAWDSFFHLTGEEQRALIPRIAACLSPGGWFLFTAGPAEGEVWGAVSGGPVWHASLSPAGYATALQEAGLHLRRFIAEDPATAGRTVVLARRGSA